MNGDHALAIASAIRANVDAFYDDSISREVFEERQVILWDRTRGDSELYALLVHMLWDRR